MENVRKPWLRGLLALGFIGALSAGLLMSPVDAARQITKKKVKKIATKIATQVATEIAPQVATEVATSLDSSLAAGVGAVSSAVSSQQSPDITLSSANSQVLTTTITLPAARRVFASASLLLYNSSAASSWIECWVRFDGSDASQRAIVSTPATGNYNIQVPVVGSANLSAGPHTAAVICMKQLGSPKYDRGDLLVWAV